jgi:serine/threonine protein phosphatase PrpC
MTIASDGLWEFITNQNVSDIVYWYYSMNNIEGAVEKLVEQAIKEWITNDNNIDDITVVVLFFNK